MAQMEMSREELLSLKSKFIEASKGDTAIFKETFRELTLLLAGEQGQKEVPSEKDIDAAFIIVDEDKSDTVDFAEFVMLYRLVKCGDVKGLSKKSMFTAGKKGTFMKHLKVSREKTDQDIREFLQTNEASSALPPSNDSTSSSDRVTDKFDIGGEIGKGALSTVFEGVHLPSRQGTGRVAIKITQKNMLQSHEKEHMKNEVACLKKCQDNGNVLRFIDFFEGVCSFKST